jgi:hypothetical protein
VTRELGRVLQAGQPTKSVTAVPVVIATVNTHTVTVTLPGGGSVTAPRGAGFTYTAGGSGWALLQEPAVIAVFPTA